MNVDKLSEFSNLFSPVDSHVTSNHGNFNCKKCVNRALLYTRGDHNIVKNINRLIKKLIIIRVVRFLSYSSYVRGSTAVVY